MSGLGVPLVVTAGTERYTDKISELTFRKESPGGCKFITFDIPIDVYRQHTALALFEHILVSDARTGTVVVDGRIHDLEVVTSEAGPAMRVTAWGPKTHAAEQSVPLIYRDNRTSTWDKDTPYTTDGFEVFEMADSDDDGESQGFRLKAVRGETIQTADEAFIEYSQLYDANLKLGRVSGTYRFGLSDANYRLVGEARINPADTYGGNWLQVDANGGSASWVRQVTADITYGDAQPRLGFVRNGSSITGARTHWCKLYNLGVYMLRYNADGTEDTTGSNYTFSLTDLQVVNDLLGRLLSRYEPGLRANLVTDLGHFAYFDSATAEQVLDDIITISGDGWWMTTAAQYYGGRARFDWWVQPFVQRYEVTLDSEVVNQTSITEVFNRVTVRFKDKRGRPRNIIRTSTDDPLTANGLVRHAFIDLGSTVNTKATAQEAGDAFLAAHSRPINSCTVQLSRPVQDLVEGLTVNPWDLKPGELVRIRGGAAVPESLEGSDALVNLGRITAIDYTASTNTAAIELNLQSRTVANALTKLEKRQVRRA